ncbi:acylphosphatase [Candidatus Woesearchaeota archaeon]|nr:acylphosphatase [Candidatus Woesearchaeota archaeon]
MQRAHIVIYGLVQGVFFRSNAKKVAETLGLKGYAGNMADGSVEIVAEGPEEKIKELVKFCKKGPKAARVDKANVKVGEASGDFDGFEIRY